MTAEQQSCAARRAAESALLEAARASPERQWAKDVLRLHADPNYHELRRLFDSLAWCVRQVRAERYRFLDLPHSWPLLRAAADAWTEHRAYELLSRVADGRFADGKQELTPLAVLEAACAANEATAAPPCWP